MKLAIVVSHPIQYYSPWFKRLTQQQYLHLKVFYLWDFGVEPRTDPDFKKKFTWDIPLLDGYEFEFVPNISPDPGTHHYQGLNNPMLVDRLFFWKPDAILTFGYNWRSLNVLLFSRKLTSIPKILRGDSHRLVPDHWLKSQIKKVLIRRVFSRFRAALYVGQANREYLKLYGFSDENIFFSPHAVDTTRYYPDQSRGVQKRQQLGITTQEKVLLFAGKFEPKKCPVELVRTFIRSAPANWRLLMVGTGALESAARNAARGDQRVIFAGFANQSEMPDFYRAADMVILPSLGRGETWGLFVQEAMCCGKPAIVSSHVGCGPDLVVEGKNGFTFPAGDWAALENILSRLPSDGDTLRNMGRESLRIVSDYSYENATRGLLSALEYVKHG